MGWLTATFYPKPAASARGIGRGAGQVYGLAYAAVWRRCAAGVADTLILGAFFSAAVFLGDQAAGFFGGFAPRPLHGDAPMAVREPAAAARAVYFLTVVTGSWLYFSLFDSGERQGTPGKRLFRIAVADAEGERISFGRASLRFIYYALSLVLVFTVIFPAIPLLGLPLVGARRQALHDLATGTIVAED